MAITVSTTNSIKTAYVPLGPAYENAYAEVITPLGATSASEERALDGSIFVAGEYNSAVASNDSVTILIQNGANDGIYLSADIFTSVDSNVILYEGPTFSAVGTGVTAYNLNRSSAKVLGATITKTPTITANGTQIGPTILQQANIKETLLLENIIILAPSTNYLLKVTNISNFAGIINVVIRAHQPNL